MANGKANTPFLGNTSGSCDIQTPNGYVSSDEGNPYREESLWYQSKPQDIIGTSARMNPFAVDPIKPSSKR